MTARTVRVACVLGVLAVGLAATARAQLVITDPTNTLKLGTIGDIEKSILRVVKDIGDMTRRFGRSFAVFEDLSRYLSPDAPKWRTRRLDPASPMHDAFMQAMNNGAPAGALVDEALTPRSPVPAGADIPPELLIDLATLDLADEALKHSITSTGTIRGLRHDEGDAVVALESDLVREGSVTKSLDLISAAAVLRGHQQSLETDLESSALDLQLVKGKRVRDALAQALMMRTSNMELVPNIGAGWGAEITAWRQP